MKHQFFWTALLVIIVVGILAACTQAATDTTAADRSEAEILIDERCSTCHSASKVYSETLTREQWLSVFEDMIAKGADVDETETTIMIDWLVSGN
jgi:uncharacterized membrane protein